MELTNVDRALKRPQQYFLEDGLWEIACGLWMVLTVALPLLVGGVAANWGWSVMLLSGLGLRPAVVAAKDRWVHPRTGHVAFPDEELGPPPVSLGLSPAAGPAAGPVPRGWARLGASLLGMVVAIAIGVTLSLSRRAGFGEKGAHVTIGLILGAFLLVAAWRWRQRRWIGVAVALPLLGAGVASSGLGGEPALAAHAAGIGCALVVSGTAAFMSYLRRAPEPSPAANGR